MKINKLKSNKAVIMSDVIIAIIILSLFVGVIGSLIYQVTKNNEKIRMNAIATDYVIKIAEDIDKMKYEDVTNDLNNNLTQIYDINDKYQITLEVQNYNEIDTSKKDIIKIVKIQIQYTALGDTQEFTIKKLKIKEL